jgi:hypothetical protein
VSGRRENYILPAWDRSDPASGLIDPTTGTAIGDLDYAGGWFRGPDGTAVREEVFLGGPPPGGAPQDDSDEVLLLLFPS